MFKVRIYLTVNGKEREEEFLTKDRIPTFTGNGEAAFIYWRDPRETGLVFYQVGTVNKFIVEAVGATAE